MATNRRVIEETEVPAVHGRAHHRDIELDRTDHFIGFGLSVLDNGEGDVWDIDEETGKVTGRHEVTEPAEAPADEPEVEEAE